MLMCEAHNAFLHLQHDCSCAQEAENVESGDGSLAIIAQFGEQLLQTEDGKTTARGAQKGEKVRNPTVQL